jgi:glycosyltransferase involved in cell wall biosynthesis
LGIQVRILHVINRFWPATGGAETYLGELSQRLVGEGHQVTVLTTDAFDPEVFWIPGLRRIPDTAAMHKGIRILRFPVRYLPGAPTSYCACRSLTEKASRKTPLPLWVLWRLSSLTPWIPALDRWLQENREKFDLVAGMNIVYESILHPAWNYACRQRIPFVLFPLTHLGVGEKPGVGFPACFYTMRHQLNLACSCGAIAAQTEVERDFYLQQGAVPDRVEVIGPGIDPDSLAGGKGERFRELHQIQVPVVTMLSSLSYDKGTRHLVEAAQQLWAAGRNFRLVLAGALTEPMPEFLASLPAADRQRILLPGSIDEAAKKDLLAATDVFAMPSRTDSFGIAYLEAWFYCKPVIGARSWGINEVIEEDRDGLLVRFGEVPALAAAIDRLLQSLDAREAMGARGREKVLRLHTWSRKYEQVRELYGRLTQESE